MEKGGPWGSISCYGSRWAGVHSADRTAASVIGSISCCGCGSVWGNQTEQNRRIGFKSRTGAEGGTADGEKWAGHCTGAVGCSKRSYGGSACSCHRNRNGQFQCEGRLLCAGEECRSFGGSSGRKLLEGGILHRGLLRS